MTGVRSKVISLKFKMGGHKEITESKREVK